MERYLSAKSVHIFAWPFQIEGDIKDFRKKVENAGYQKKPMHCSNMTVGNGMSEREWQDAYMLTQYLSVPTREIFTNKADKVCGIYQLPKGKIPGLAYYIDAVWKAGDVGKRYYLPLEHVELHLYQCGVGILFLQVLNGDEKSTIEDIKVINDLGRRVSLPYLLEKEDVDEHWDRSIVAKRLGIVKRVGKDELLKKNYVDFAEWNKQFYESKGANGKQLLSVAPFLMDLLNGSPLGEQKENLITEKDIRLHTDDRMYTMAVIRDKNLSTEIEGGEWKQTKEAQEKYYSLIYVDAGAASCTDVDMRVRLLDEAVYPRWLGWGTLHAVTNYSMLCITTDEEFVNDSVVRPYINEYKYLLSLVIAQRMGIEHYAIETAKLAENAGQRRFSNGKIRKLFRLQVEYITFKNQMLVIEASCQQQGIELYEMLQKQLLIEQEREQLDNLLTCMYEMADVSRSRNTEVLSIWISIAAFLVSVISLWVSS